MMSMIVASLFLTVGLVVLCAVKWRRSQPAPERKSQSVAQLEDILRTAQITNSSFFQSLELVQKNLEALLARAESAEQRLRALMLQPGAEKKEQYTAAALLLGEGQEPQRVAAMLNMPLPQVQIVRELQGAGGREKKLPARRSQEEQLLARAFEEPQTKVAGRREKSAAPPMLLVDVIRKAASDAAKQENEQRRFTGIHA